MTAQTRPMEKYSNKGTRASAVQRPSLTDAARLSKNAAPSEVRAAFGEILPLTTDDCERVCALLHCRIDEAG